MTTSVLIVGAGPTGLASACTLLLNGVDCRVVDRRAGPSDEPKAIVLWSGALEALRRIGAADAVLAESLPLASAGYWSKGRRIARIGFGALRGTAFPRPLCVPQPVTERALYDRLRELGGEVEWGVAAAECRTTDRSAVVRVETPAPDEITAEWVIAADGGRSRIRESLGIAFEGDTYDRDFLLGDGIVSGDPPEDQAQYHLGPDGVLVVVPLPGGGHRVFFDTVPGHGTAAPDTGLLQRLLDERGHGRMRLERTWWTSRFRVHARLAERFRSGRVFLAGDAAHVHSPAGGQGLNTGVQDGYDIGWKLAAVLHGAPERLLESYAAERRPASARAVRNADRQTRIWLLRSPAARALRDRVMGALSAARVLERRFVPELAQLDNDHSASPAVSGSAAGAGGRMRPGRRAADGRLLMQAAVQEGADGATATGGAGAGGPGGGRPAGPEQSTVAEQSARGRHLVVVSGTPAEVEATARSARAALPAQVGVLRMLPDGSPGGTSPSELPVAVDLDGVFPSGRGGAALTYIRPDAVVGALAANLQTLLADAALPTDDAPTAAHRERAAPAADAETRPRAAQEGKGPGRRARPRRVARRRRVL
ncbi:FAD-dependent monooxygenase [Streptomonospora wellingtoniae]|uniref:FAD-dependent monooxygenase n=1 Tax=Streptomonospora wellingtoniae TaxID=3075544 RepID=A0ABU2KT45_9ACTN|nr:FAD-dependent monooxygenase [Streptomonospora sp. DSM 45055]MDT0302381.1 FAD-dependent monooxygenase [Streptomonospora sp. DSM 45055]